MRVVNDINELIGKKFGKLMITEHLGVIRRRTRVNCVCECGKIKDYVLQDLRSGNTKSCGCYRPPPISIYEYIGNRFGKLVLTQDLGMVGKKRKVICVCDCGVSKEYEWQNLKLGHTKSCGCLKVENGLIATKTHGLASHPLYKCWNNMLHRCYTESSIGYDNYGGNGVVVCDEWRNDFLSFYKWAISNGWQLGLQLDKDKLSSLQTGKIYSPEFCCFISRKENMRHTTKSTMVTYNNVSKCVTEWAEMLGVKPQILFWRLRNGWEVKEAFETVPLNNNGFNNTE